MKKQLTRGDKIRFLCTLDTVYGRIEKGSTGYFHSQRYSDVAVNVLPPNNPNSMTCCLITVRHNDIERA